MSSSSSTTEHDWEFSKENAAPLEYGRSTKSLSKRAFGTSTAEMVAIEEKTKKYEKLVRRSEKAVEWMQKQSKKIIEQSSSSNNGGKSKKGSSSSSMDRELTTDEAETLRTRLVLEIGFDPSTTDRDNIDYDPMRYWVLYIKHIRESYPSDSQKQFLLMERCARTFMARPFIIPSYQNDVRFIRTCILYADKTSNPSEVFKLMSKIKVGTKVSLFWVAWAWVAEKAQDFPFTEKIFQKALSVGAEPKQFLEERQRQFLRRMSRHWLNASQAQEDGLEEEDDEGGGRGALYALSSEGIARNDRVASGRGASSRSQPQQTFRDSSRSTLHRIKENQPTVGFNIFQDGDNNDEDVLDDVENDPRGAQRLARESERTKENSQRAEMWNERGGLTSSSTAAPDVGSDSIVGSSFGGGRPPLVGHQRSGSSSAAFEVFVDEEFNEENEVSELRETSFSTDQRSLRQRLDGGTADRLTRDPLRYMKNPSKLESDQIKYDAMPSATDEEVPPASDREEKKRASLKKPDSKEYSKPPSGARGFDKQLVKADSSGHECCFHERRLYGRHYKLISPSQNFNSLKQDDNNKSSSRMDTEDSTMNVDTSIEDVDMEEETQEIIVTKPIKSVLKKSSLRTRPAEPTTSEEEENTGTVPRRVLFGANTSVVFSNNASVDTSTASSQLNSSFAPVEETINTKLANAEISMMFSSPNGNASMAETPGKSLFSTNRKKDNGDDDDDGFVKPKPSRLEPGSLNFSIYQDDEMKDPVGGMPFDIHDDDGKTETGTLNFSYSQTASKMNFSIYHEEDGGNKQERKMPPPSASGGEDTASYSVLNGILEGGGDDKSSAAPLGFGIYTDDEPSDKRSKISSSKQTTTSRSLGRGREKKKTVVAATEDTADLSLINGVMDSLEDCSVKQKPQKSGFTIFSDENDVPKEPTEKPSGMGFEIFEDEATIELKQKQKVSTNPCFGDISMIEDEKTSNFEIMNENEVASSNAIDYTSQHKEDQESAMRKCLSAAAKSRSQYDIFDYRRQSMPRALLKRSFTTGTKIELSRGETLTIRNELGRGVYGVVLLCNDESGQSDALKIQAPIGSLAHEYSLLMRIEDRVEPDERGFYPFPRSRALYAYSEGGLFSMTAGSDSGMNLIDVVNTYKKLTGNVPELVAIYYTSRMLKYLESLHQDGKVLHCDIKPDNWVLTSSSKDVYNAGTNAVSGADLMLVDFGRSVDLEKVASLGSNLLQTQFKGNIAAEDMECVAMRKGLPWGIDLDFYGVAASSFILLFGSHLEVTQDRSSGKWRPHKSFRRYWQRDLWTLLFDTLLNFDSSSDDYAIGNIRIAFDEYIEGKDRKREITTHLNQLFTHLPKKR